MPDTTQYADQSERIAQLYSDHQQWLQHWLCRRLSNASDAPDILQSTFEKVLLKPQEALAADEPRAWLTAIARHLVIDHQRRLSLEQAFRHSLASLPEGMAPSPEELLMLQQVLDRLDAMLSGLGPKVKAVFLLARLEGLSYAQIARQLGISHATVEKHMVKAIAHCLRVRREHAL